MKTMKKLIAISLVVVMLFALAVPAIAWVYDPDHIATKADANSTNLIASPDEEIVLNAGKLPDGATVSLGGASADANWKYAYPFQLDKTFTPGSYDGAHKTDMYFMWDDTYFYIKEYHRDTLTVPASNATAIKGPMHDAVEYNIVAPGLDFSTRSRATGVVIDVFPTVTSGVSENRVIVKVLSNSVGNQWSYTTSDNVTYSGMIGGGSVSGAQTDTAGKQDGENQNVVSYGRLLSDGTWELETAITWAYLDKLVYQDPFANVAPGTLMGFKYYSNLGSGSAFYHTITVNQNKDLDGGGVSTAAGTNDLVFHNVYDYFAPLYLRAEDAKASEQLIDTSWYDNTETTFEISTAGQLRGLSYICNQWQEFDTVPHPTNGRYHSRDITMGKAFNITADIDLNPNWSVDEDATVPPLYVWYDLACFCGTLNGNGYTIRGFYADDVWCTNLLKGSDGKYFFDIRATGDDSNDTNNGQYYTQHRGFISEIYGHSTAANINDIVFENCKVVSKTEAPYTWEETTNSTNDAGEEVSTTVTRTEQANVGGLIGFHRSGAGVTIENVYADIDVEVHIPTANDGAAVSGIMGKMSNAKAIISNVVYAGNYRLTGDDGIGAYVGAIWGNGVMNTSNAGVADDVLVMSKSFTYPASIAGSTRAFTNGGSRNENNVRTLNSEGKYTGTGGGTVVNGVRTYTEAPVPTHWVNVDADAKVGETLVKMPPEVAAMVGRNMQVQRSTTVDGETSFKVRVLTVVDAIEWAKLGVKVELSYNGSDYTALPEDLFPATTTVYTSVEAAGETLTAEELGGKYVSAISMSGIPSKGTVKFRITPIYYGVDANGNECQYTNGHVANVTYVDGVFQK